MNIWLNYSAILLLIIILGFGLPAWGTNPAPDSSTSTGVSWDEDQTPGTAIPDIPLLTTTFAEGSKNSSGIQLVDSGVDTPITLSTNGFEYIVGEPVPLSITGSPGDEVYLWIDGVGMNENESGDIPPVLTRDQEGVMQDDPAGPYPIGAYQYTGGAGRSVKSEVPDDIISHGTAFYGRVHIPSEESVHIQLLTGPGTRQGQYTIHGDTDSGRSGDVVISIVKPPTVIPSDESVSDFGSGPKLSAEGDAAGITAGDPYFISGKTPMSSLGTIAVWLFGEDLVRHYSHPVNGTGSFRFELPGIETGDLNPGTYAVVIQAPGYDDRYDLYPDNSTSPRELLGPRAQFIMRLRGDGARLGTDGAGRLIEGVSGGDDQYVLLSLGIR
ncbi:MAG TPA: hypothetical protein VN372_09385 [Methanospirillum sp.]|nr:hypothetical protein [Methanospirillum sp.]